MTRRIRWAADRGTDGSLEKPGPALAVAGVAGRAQRAAPPDAGRSSRAAAADTDETLVPVLAGGEGRRLLPLTEGRPKPTIPFAGSARVIDFALANCARSGLDHVCVLGQYRAELFQRHLQARWPTVGLRTPEPVHGAGGYLGTAHAVACNLDLVERHGARQVVVLASDHVYWMDYGELLRTHRERQAAATLCGVDVDLAEADRFGIMAVEDDARVTRFEEKPAVPAALPGRGDRALASMGIYVFDAEALVGWLGSGDGEDHRDFGGDLIPALVETGEAVHAHRFGDEGSGAPGYWRDIGSIHSYWRSSLEMVHPDSPHRMAAAGTCLPGCGWPSCLSRLEADTAAAHAVISCGPPIRSARIERSVLCCGVAVGEGAQIEDSVVLEGARIGRGARLRGVVVDRGADIPPGIHVQSRHADPWGGGREARAGVVPALRRLEHDGPTAGSADGDCCQQGCTGSGWGGISPYGPAPPGQLPVPERRLGASGW